jgi:hypothetical protein
VFIVRLARDALGWITGVIERAREGTGVARTAPAL